MKHVIGEVIVTVGLFGLLLGGLILGCNQVKVKTNEEKKQVLEKAIKKAVIECYALEGMYPPNIAYIEQNYGVIIDHQHYIVHYEAFAANIMPDIMLIEEARR